MIRSVFLSGRLQHSFLSAARSKYQVLSNDDTSHLPAALTLIWIFLDLLDPEMLNMDIYGVPIWQTDARGRHHFLCQDMRVQDCEISFEARKKKQDYMFQLNNKKLHLQSKQKQDKSCWVTILLHTSYFIICNFRKKCVMIHSLFYCYVFVQFYCIPQYEEFSKALCVFLLYLCSV